MKIGKDGIPEMSKEEVLAAAKEMGASDHLFCRLKRLIGHYDSARLFFAAKDDDHRKIVKYGPRMKKYVKAIREKCYFLKEEAKSKHLCGILNAEWRKEMERKYQEAVDRLNPVFTYRELERILQVCQGLEFVDMMFMSLVRRPMALAEQEKLRRRYEKAEKDWQKKELDGLDNVASELLAKSEGQESQEEDGNAKK